MAYNAELERGKVSSETQFSYAWCLIKGDDKTDILKGVLLLQGKVTFSTLFQIIQITQSNFIKLGIQRKKIQMMEDLFLFWPFICIVINSKGQNGDCL